MFAKKFRYNTDDKEWKLLLPFTSNWKHSKNRLMIILESVQSEDFDSGVLGGSDLMRTTLTNVIKHAQIYAKSYSDERKDFDYSIVNFNAYRHYHLGELAKSHAEKHFARRVKSLIKKMKPTHILFCGDASLLFDIENAPYKNGWVHSIDSMLVTSSLDVSSLLDNGDKANLLGFVFKHLGNLMLGYLPHSLHNIKQRSVYVDNMSLLDDVLAAASEAKYLALDTEDRNLSVNKNAIYTVQFCADGKLGWVIPVDHPHKDNPWSTEQRIKVKEKLRNFFSMKNGPILITQNGSFDLKVLRSCLDIEIIYLRVWEITAGEHLLDENISLLSKVGIKSGGLAAIFCAYGNDYYYKSDFSKAERTTFGMYPPNEPKTLAYAAMDVVSIFNIAREQIKKAEKKPYRNGNYKSMFKRHMLNQASDTVHQISHMEQNGSLVDIDYLRSLLKRGSPLMNEIIFLEKELRDYPEVKEANKQLEKESGLGGSLFDDNHQWFFSWSKPAHRAKLFFDVIGLDVISRTKKTKAPSTDGDFVDYYKDRNLLVSKYGELAEAMKIYSTYVKGWYKRLSTDADASDGFLRASFLFFSVLTGRLSSKDPNLQNIPSRGRLAKVIKKMFISCDGYMLIRMDYSAHEVRSWGIISEDSVIAKVFRTGYNLRKQWIKTPTEAVKNELKKKGDSHIQSVFLFFEKWVEKSDPLRDAIKKIIFGLIYGMSVKTLSLSIKSSEIDAIKSKMAEARNKKDDAELKILAEKFKDVYEEDRDEYTQSLIDKLFGTFKKGHLWIKRTTKEVETKYMVSSPIGRIRHMYSVMTGDKKIIREQIRRGVNAPVQGFASQISIAAARLTELNYIKTRDDLNLGAKKLIFNRTVHDANYYMVPFEMVIPFLHILQHCTTVGIARNLEKIYGFEFNVDPEIEIEVSGTRDTETKKWDWSLDNILKILTDAVKEGCEQKFYSGSEKEIMETIMHPWVDKEKCKWLDENYPLLGVPLYKEIRKTVKTWT